MDEASEFELNNTLPYLKYVVDVDASISYIHFFRYILFFPCTIYANFNSSIIMDFHLVGAMVFERMNILELINISSKVGHFADLRLRARYFCHAYIGCDAVGQGFCAHRPRSKNGGILIVRCSGGEGVSQDRHR